MFSGDPGKFAGAVTQSNTVNDPRGPFRALYVGTSGDISLVDMAGDTTVFPSVPVGMFPMGGLRVNVTDTTASGLRHIK